MLDLAAQSPETQFLLAWRTSGDQIQAAVAAKGLKNVKVLAARLDMETFYDQVDAVILPFGRSWGNHSCPLSAVEGHASRETRVGHGACGHRRLATERGSRSGNAAIG